MNENAIAWESESTDTSMGPTLPSSVLVVDDDPAFRTVVRAWLEAEGLAALEAGSGEEALAILENTRSDPLLVLVDLWLGGMTGVDLAERIAGVERFADVPVVCVTADPMAAREMYRGTDWTRVLEKPLEGPEFTRAIRGLVGHGGSTQARPGSLQ